LRGRNAGREFGPASVGRCLVLLSPFAMRKLKIHGRQKVRLTEGGGDPEPDMPLFELKGVAPPNLRSHLPV